MRLVKVGLVEALGIGGVGLLLRIAVEHANIRW